MSTNKLSVYLNVNGEKEAEAKLKRLGKHGTVALNGITASAKPVNSSLMALNSTVGTVGKSMQAFAGIAGAYLGFQGIQGTISGIIQTNTEFQTLSASLVVVEKDADRAALVLSKLDKFAAQTPYALQSLTDAWIKLRALGLQPSEEALLSYGNTSSAMGKDIMQFIEAIADASTMEFERLKEFGIKASQQGEEVSLTFQGVTTTVQKNAEDIKKYLTDIGNVQFAGAMEKQMDAIGGSISNKADQMASYQRDVGNAGFNDAYIDLNKSIAKSFEENAASAEVLGKSLAVATNGITGVINNLDILKDAALAFGAFKAMQLGAVATTTAFTATTLATRNMALTLAASSAIAGKAATAQIAAMSAMSVAARGLTAAMGLVGGPLGVIAIAGFSIYQFTKETDKSAEVAGKYSKELEEVRKSTQGLTDATDELTKTTGKARKIALLEQLEQIKGDMAEVQDELLNGAYWSNNWITNQWEKLDKDENFNRYIEQYKDGVIDLEGLHTRIIKLGELQPEYRDEALKFDKRYQSLKALELATERTQKKLHELENPKSVNTTVTSKVESKVDFSGIKDLKFDDKTESLDSLMEKAKYAASTVGSLERKMNTQLDPNSWVYGAAKGIDDVSKDSMNFAKLAEDTVKSSFKSMEDGIVNFVTTGKFQFDDFVNTVLDGILRIQIQQAIIQPLSKGISAYFGGEDSSGGDTTNASVNHTGGIAGSGGVSRSVPTELFANAPRYHSGGYIRQDEVPIIAQKGEVILSRQTVQSMSRPKPVSQAPVININVQNNGNSKVSAEASQNANGFNIDILVEELEGKFANNVARNRGSLNNVLNQKYQANRAAR